MRVNIVYEVNNREFLNCLLIQRELIKRGHDARIYNKTESFLLEDNSKSVTLIPNSYRKEDLDFYRYTFNTKDGSVIVYPCEQITNHKMPEFFDYSDKNPVKNLPHLCWGQDYYEYINKLGFTNINNAVVGAIQLDFCRKEFAQLASTREELSEKYSIPANKKWILFISDFVYNSEIMTERIIQSGDQTEEVIRSRNRFSNKSCSEILVWFDRFLKSHDDYVLIYRKHPVELLTKDMKEFTESRRGRVYTISELNIKEWIFNCDRITSWYSTALVECVAAQKNMILLRPYVIDDDSGFVEYDFYKSYPKATTYEMLCEALENNNITADNKTKEIIDNMYSVEDRPAFKRIADAIERIAEEKHEYDDISTCVFQAKRWLFMIYNMTPAKVGVKKIVQRLYVILGSKFDAQWENKWAINEWIASANNRSKQKELSQKLDEIICRI